EGAAGQGLDGVATFEEAYARWPERYPDRLGDALRGLRIFIVKAGTGGALFRGLHATFLHDASPLLGAPDLDAAGDVYDELAATWVALSEVEDHADGTEHVERIGRLEREGVEAMERALVDG